jgi:hypothetical protein
LGVKSKLEGIDVSESSNCYSPPLDLDIIQFESGIDLFVGQVIISHGVSDCESVVSTMPMEK